jgi:hypothetical protein
MRAWIQFLDVGIATHLHVTEFRTIALPASHNLHKATTIGYPAVIAIAVVDGIT